MQRNSLTERFKRTLNQIGGHSLCITTISKESLKKFD